MSYTGFLGIVVCSFMDHCCVAQTGEEAVQLHGFLFNSTQYNKRVRPVKNQTLPVKVKFIY